MALQTRKRISARDAANPELVPARAEQLAHHAAQAEKLAERMRELSEGLEDWSFVMPASPNPATWQGVARYCAFERMYAWHCEREARLRLGRGPFYCPDCEAKPGNGWMKGNCLDCDWKNWMAREAIDGRPVCVEEEHCLHAFAGARRLGAPVQCCGRTFRPGREAKEHYGTDHRRDAA